MNVNYWNWLNGKSNYVKKGINKRMNKGKLKMLDYRPGSARKQNILCLVMHLMGWTRKFAEETY
jgi:hypothetical protein